MISGEIKQPGRAGEEFGVPLAEVDKKSAYGLGRFMGNFGKRAPGTEGTPAPPCDFVSGPGHRRYRGATGRSPLPIVTHKASKSVPRNSAQNR